MKKRAGDQQSATLESTPETLPECTIIGEIGINHNGDMDLCKKLMMATKVRPARLPS